MGVTLEMSANHKGKRARYQEIVSEIPGMAGIYPWSVVHIMHLFTYAVPQRLTPFDSCTSHVFVL